MALTNEQRRQDYPASSFDTWLLLADLASWSGAKQQNADTYGPSFKHRNSQLVGLSGLASCLSRSQHGTKLSGTCSDSPFSASLAARFSIDQIRLLACCSTYTSTNGNIR